METDLDIEYGYRGRPSSLLNSIFMSTVNTAAKSLVSVASRSKAENNEKWKPADHLRFMVMLMTWLTLWVLRVLMDHFPCSLGPSPHNLLGGGFSSVGSLELPPSSPSSSSTALAASASSLNLILQEEVDGPSVRALGRALSHILALLNEIPATSRKYQFAMAMAENIMDENARNGHVELQHVNRMALASAFARTLSLLYHSLQRNQVVVEDSGAWTARAIKALPLGSYVASYMKGMSHCLSSVFSWADAGTSRLQKGREIGGVAGGEYVEDYGDVCAEKLGQQLLWITNKLRAYDAVDEALVQWSFASGLASLSLTASPRVQGFIVKISAILFGDLTQEYSEVSRQVKFRLLVLWLPLLCHSSNGLAYPILTHFEKAEAERVMDEVISSLPTMDQEVILTNWLQDFAVSASDWPNLKVSYDQWCQSTRRLVT